MTNLPGRLTHGICHWSFVHSSSRWLRKTVGL